jgi:hypothetical protein
MACPVTHSPGGEPIQSVIEALAELLIDPFATFVGRFHNLISTTYRLGKSLHRESIMGTR